MAGFGGVSWKPSFGPSFFEYSGVFTSWTKPFVTKSAPMRPAATAMSQSPRFFAAAAIVESTTPACRQAKAISNQKLRSTKESRERSHPCTSFSIAAFSTESCAPSASISARCLSTALSLPSAGGGSAAIAAASDLMCSAR
ncbi:MAG: hypothetical protein HY293_23050 [Planctomycetes bacterium]|nr:hypothetical protein [Planctomycetota bacterium]